MSRLLDHPMMLLIVLAVILLLFGAPRLPGMARSLGQSMRAFRAEVKEMRDDTGWIPEGPRCSRCSPRWP
jgi:sec-independent protein translocase protein TatA